MTTAYTLAILGFLAVLWLPTPKPEEWPAWVQAVGSISAIFALVGVTFWEAERARKTKREELREVRRAFAGLARMQAIESCKMAASLIDEPAWHANEGTSFYELKSISAAIEQLDQNTLRSGEAVLILHKLRLQAQAAEHIVEHVVDEYYNGMVIICGEPLDVQDLVRSWSDRADNFASKLEEIAEGT